MPEKSTTPVVVTSHEANRQYTPEGLAPNGQRTVFQIALSRQFVLLPAVILLVTATALFLPSLSLWIPISDIVSMLARWCWSMLVLTTTALTSTKVVSLSELSWTLSSPSLNITVPGKVPSSVHLDLWDAKVITDPYHGLNDYDLRWVIHSNWTYTAELPQTAQNTALWLLFNGLDTFTTITLCGKHVAATNNQFRQYYFDVTKILRQCTEQHKLSIDFGDATTISERIANLPGQNTWPPNVEGIFQFQHRQFIRKEQNDFGWDWGPAFAPAGVWQPAFLLELGNSDVYARNTLVDIYRQDQLPLLPPDQSKPWIMNASIDYIGSLPGNAWLEYDLTTLNGVSISHGNLTTVFQASNTISGWTSIDPTLVDLWWPSGMGNQTLYRLSIQVKTEKDGRLLTTVNRRVGFRTIILNQEPIRKEQIEKGVAPGSNWHFEINGKEFYAKGSNFIPPDTFWTRVTEKRIRNLFNAVQKGNQNMLRLWSSGAYLPDYAYDIADELGILLWSEFQFGDALYPVDADFLNNVKEEAHYQVRRINHHPSLALWAGGNELENLELNMIKNHPEFGRYLAEYEKLFLGVLGTTVFQNSRSISYTPSSTSNGWLKLDFTKAQPITQRYDNISSSEEIHGNRDHYNYNSAVAFDTDNYPVGRFANEFGFHSMPSIQTWRQAVNEEDLFMESEVVRLRNRHYPPGGVEKNFMASDTGMEEMIEAAQRYYPMPNKTDAAANFTSWCHITQIFQADFYSSQIQFYRRGSGMRERQLGSLYWQLEDIWQAPTWAGIEYDGRWKVLHYVAKDRYKNVIISPFFQRENGQLDVYATSDLLDAVDANVTLTWYDWSGKELHLKSKPGLQKSIQIGSINTTHVARFEVDEVLATMDDTNAVLHMEVSALGRLPNSSKQQQFLHQNWFHPVPLSKSKLKDPGLKITHLPDQLAFRVEATKAIAPWVWIDYPAGAIIIFEDNGFWLKPGQARIVGYDIQSDSTGGQWVEGITVESLWDMTLS